MNNSQGDNNITRFFSSVSRKISQLGDEISKGHDPSILLLALIDTLSFYASPSESSNRKRFINLIDTYSEWEDKDRVSLPQLQHLLNRIKIQIPSQKYTQLTTEVSKRINNWKYGRIYRPSEVDPPAQDLNNYKDNSTEYLINSVRYAELLWVTRNWLVHTFSKPTGFGADIGDVRSSPYYIGTIGEKSWTLVIPSQVIYSIVENCSKNLQVYFEKNNINPYDQIPFTECWLSARDIKWLENKIRHAR
ncbi:MAG: hypothetical protein AB1599_05335 [Planctomycetota bacterium]